MIFNVMHCHSSVLLCLSKRDCTLVQLLFFPLKLRFYCGLRAVCFVWVFLHCLPLVPSHLSMQTSRRSFGSKTTGISCVVSKGGVLLTVQSVYLSLFLYQTHTQRGPFTFSPNFSLFTGLFNVLPDIFSSRPPLLLSLPPSSLALVTNHRSLPRVDSAL